MDKDTPPDTAHDVVVDAIDKAIDAIDREIKAGSILAPYAAHRATGTKKKYVTAAYIVTRTIRADTGTAIARNTIYKDTHTATQAKVESQAEKFEERLNALLNAPPTNEPTEIELLKEQLSFWKARCTKMQDHLHVMYARERWHRTNARKNPLSKRSSVTTLK